MSVSHFIALFNNKLFKLSKDHTIMQTLSLLSKKHPLTVSVPYALIANSFDFRSVFVLS